VGAAVSDLSDCAGLALLAKIVVSIKSAKTIGSQVIGIQSIGKPGTATAASLLSNFFASVDIFSSVFPRRVALRH
jgi:hypothetical protein